MKGKIEVSNIKENEVSFLWIKTKSNKENSGHGLDKSRATSWSDSQMVLITSKTTAPSRGTEPE